MDSRQIELATALIHMSSLFGFITNTIAFMTVKLNTKLHTSFGIICACLAANNSFVLVMNSVWYLMPDSEIFVAGSLASRVVGMIGLTLWMLGNRFHLLISFNRLIAIATPFTSFAYMTHRNTIFVAAFALFTAALQCSPLILVESVWFCYDRKTMRWIFRDTENGRFFVENVCNLAVTMELALILLLDIITIAHLRTYNKNKVLSDANAVESRSTEIRLFKQIYEAVRDRIEQGLAQLKNFNPLNIRFSGFLRVLMTMDILILPMDASLAPDDVTSKSVSGSGPGRHRTFNLL